MNAQSCKIIKWAQSSNMIAKLCYYVLRNDMTSHEVVQHLTMFKIRFILHKYSYNLNLIVI